MIRRPLVLPDLMLRIHAPNRNEIAGGTSTAPGTLLDVPPATRFVFVCFTNRCGSAYLGDVLSSTGVFGQPYESLNAPETLPCCKAHGLRSFTEYFSHIVRRDSKDNIYIVKVMPEQILLLCETGILDQIVERSAFLIMIRSDRLAQAISQAIVQQNNRWTWDAPGTLPDEKLLYPADQIAQNMQHIALLNISFEQFFALNGIVPIMVEYEHLVAAPQLELDRLALRLGLRELKMDANRLRYRRQANAINRDWRSRFLTEPSPASEATIGDTSMRRGDRPAVPSPMTAQIIAHVQNVGDVTGACGAWIGMPGSGLPIEGFSITPGQDANAEDIEYLGITAPGQPPQWVPGGTFCGTRGLGSPLLAMGMRLRNAARSRYGCACSFRFVDGTEIGPVAADQLTHAGSLAPLEAFQILVGERSQIA
ncbi:MAG TPA: Stf0 family sulfotransferase [Acetobacteraceae bacterium]|jgi:LPS sulfotransferase NodH